MDLMGWRGKESGGGCWKERTRKKKEGGKKEMKI